MRYCEGKCELHTNSITVLERLREPDIHHVSPSSLASLQLIKKKITIDTFHFHVYCSVMHNSQDVKITQLSIILDN